MDREYSRVTTYVGATGRVLTWQAKDEDGAAYDLSGFASATISIRLGENAAANYKVSADTVTITAGTSGYHTWVDAGGDLDTPGEYIAQVRLVDGSGDVDYLDEVVIEVLAPTHNV